MGANMSNTNVINEAKATLGTETVNTIRNDCSALFSSGNLIELTGLDNVNLGDISQMNNLKNNCQISSAIDALQKANASADLISKLKEMQDATGLFGLNQASVQAQNYAKTQIDTTVVNQIENDCRAKFDQASSNIYIMRDSTNSTVGNVIQNNSIFNECVQYNTLKAVNETDASTKTDSTIDISQKAGLSMEMLIIILLIVVVVIFGTGGKLLAGLKDPANWPVYFVIGVIIFFIIMWAYNKWVKSDQNSDNS